MRSRLMSAGLVLALAAPLGGCVVVSSPYSSPYGEPVYARPAPNAAVGTLSGALIGGVIGSAFGRGGGAVAATLAGAAIGGLIGNAIGRDLDERDREMALVAERDALGTGRPRRWRSETVYGEVIPGPIYVAEEGPCRSFIHRIFIDGRPAEAEGIACRMPNGRWRVVG